MRLITAVLLRGLLSHYCLGTVETSVADSPALVYNYGNGNL